MCNELSWCDHTPDTDWSRRGELPSPLGTHPSIGGGPGLGFRRVSPRVGDPSPSTKRGPPRPAGTGVPGGWEGLSLGTSATSDAIGVSAF